MSEDPTSRPPLDAEHGFSEGDDIVVSPAGVVSGANTEDDGTILLMSLIPG